MEICKTDMQKIIKYLETLPRYMTLSPDNATHAGHGLSDNI